MFAYLSPLRGGLGFYLISVNLAEELAVGMFNAYKIVGASNTPFNPGPSFY